VELKFWIEIGLLLLTGSGIYWRVHYKTKELSNDSLSQKELIQCLQNKDIEQDKAIADLKVDVEKRLNDFEKLLNKRLTRIEKILIRIDERMQLRAAKDLIEPEED
jgi:phosphatidate phosphatase PAH1